MNLLAEFINVKPAGSVGATNDRPVGKRQGAINRFKSKINSARLATGHNFMFATVTGFTKPYHRSVARTEKLTGAMHATMGRRPR